MRSGERRAWKKKDENEGVNGKTDKRERMSRGKGGEENKVACEGEEVTRRGKRKRGV